MNLLPDQKLTTLQLKEQETFMSDGKISSCRELRISVAWTAITLTLALCRFLHPIVYGEYPKTIQNIVGNRLPKFTQEEVKIVKGSIDFVGINQYTTYYMFDPHQPKPKYLGYQQDWNCGFACKNTLPPPSTHTHKKKNFFMHILLCSLSVLFLWTLQMKRMECQLVQG